MNTEQLIEKHLFGKKPEKWDDEFDRIQHLSVNDVRAMLDEHAKCVLSDVRLSFLEEVRAKWSESDSVEFDEWLYDQLNED